MKKIVIIGAGFGGVYTAKHLQKILRNKHDFGITLINPKNHFLFTPLLHEVATGGLEPHNATIPLRDIFSSNVKILLDTVTQLDFEQKKIILSDNKSINYDYLVIGAGAKTISEDDLNSYSNVFMLKTLEDALKLKNHLIVEFEKASTSPSPIVIVGGGATGVEITAEMVGYAKQFDCDCSKMFYLITRDTSLLNKYPSKVQKLTFEKLKQMGVKIILSTSVTEVTPEGVVLSDGTKIVTSSIIWVPGVVPETEFLPNNAPKAKNSRLLANQFLQLKDHQEVFCIGDIADGSPMLAQVAVKQSKIVAHNILNLNAGITMVDFAYKDSGFLVSLGKFDAIGLMGNKVFSGFFAWWLWRTVYLLKMPSTKKKIKIMIDWTLNLFYKRDITRV